MTKIAIVHDWLNGMRGGEILLEEILNTFPAADIHTLFYYPQNISSSINSFPIFTSLFQKFPFALKKRYRFFLPFFPWLIKTIDVSAYDYIFSVSHCVAKAVKKKPGQIHICYCNSPMRYLYDQFDVYFRNAEGKLKLSGMVLKSIRKLMQNWDRKTSSDDYVDYFIANSNNIAGKLKNYWGRDSEVIYPFVNDHFYTPEESSESVKSSGRGEYYLIVSALVPYKRIDIAVKAFNITREKLIVAGEGTEFLNLKGISGDNITFTGRVSDTELRNYYRNCRALIFPGEEDFGIVPLEAMSCGKPVIAFGKGGVTETVVENKTGVFFKEPSPESLNEAIERFNKMSINPEDCRKRAEEFSRNVFREKLKRVINNYIRTD